MFSTQLLTLNYQLKHPHASPELLNRMSSEIKSVKVKSNIGFGAQSTNAKSKSLLKTE